MNNNFEILNNFKGFGNPNGRIWFIGIEEAQDFENDLDNLLEKYSRGYFPFESNDILDDSIAYGRSYTQVYSIMAKIIVGLDPKTDWRSYRNNNLLQENSNEFQMNLYPLGKKSIDTWNTFYQNEFSFVDKKSYLEFVKSSRFPKLFEYWKSHQPALTICFGLENSEDFKRVFSLGNGILLKESNILCYPENKLVITPFFGNQQMGWTRIGQTIEAIKEFGDF